MWLLALFFKTCYPAYSESFVVALCVKVVALKVTVGSGVENRSKISATIRSIDGCCFRPLSPS